MIYWAKKELKDSIEAKLKGVLMRGKYNESDIEDVLDVFLREVDIAIDLNSLKKALGEMSKEEVEYYNNEENEN